MKYDPNGKLQKHLALFNKYKKYAISAKTTCKTHFEVFNLKIGA